MFKKKIIPIIILLTVFVVTPGAFSGGVKAAAKTTAKKVAIVIPANWKTFKNKTYSISFKYPPKFVSKIDSSSWPTQLKDGIAQAKPLFNSDGLVVMVVEHPLNEAATEFNPKFNGSFKRSSFIVDGRAGYLLTYTTLNSGARNCIIELPIDSAHYVRLAGKPAVNSNVPGSEFNKVLTSLKFDKK